MKEQRLGKHVVMPAGVEIAFMVPSEPSHTVEARYPHDRHGNAGKTSHSAKTSGMNMTMASRETGGYCVKVTCARSGWR